ncbi:hypothetical protein EDEG_00486 [Edhazardia aedis USNM 41457]|uniref:Myb/SANT-like DNA-binding domain-containing protein n=1 Tax=Edhazardia aedis (strain USNM 41457) TaxID=1003232 RepID=J9D0C5_EDHAE|nr:hypothetical protein EDEG_00486 [Edhazardia aedis USNM 41457]|eukprot:EJW01326.1 hypothetical protein EDEG_00486 [Edhazardia aedis USNM 41457]
MADTTPKWSDESVLKLIKLKHSDEFQQKFKKAERNPMLMHVVWKEIADYFDEVDYNAERVKTKYNYLLGKYRYIKNSELKGDSSEKTKWKFWDIFHSTYSKYMNGFSDDSITVSFPDIASNEINVTDDESESNVGLSNAEIHDLVSTVLNKYIKFNKGCEDVFVTKREFYSKMNEIDEKVTSLLEIFKKLEKNK